MVENEVGKASPEKVESLAERKKALKEKEHKPLFSFTVTVMDNNDVKVEGPINDPLLVMRMLAGAMNVVVDHNHSTEKLLADTEVLRQEKEKSRIVGLDGGAP